MTLQEVAAIYGVKVFRPSRGSNIRDISIAIYDSDSSKFMESLRLLNNRYDWDGVALGAEIKYLPKTYLDYVNLW